MPNHFTLKVFWTERCGLLWSHSNSDIFTCEDNMLFSSLWTGLFPQTEKSSQASYFHMWVYQVFARKLTWYFIGVYIIQLIISRGGVLPIMSYTPRFGPKGVRTFIRVGISPVEVYKE